ncbi:gamma-tubulin complex component 5-like [Dorcoceras hygrometricum]|uniref:Gamma-tubulin complex component 5-like n=1 Tax=Dorcoceras hygrometricum TaxID=472368 RepID=A0A2Z7BEP7_9LAMI|nr:gamma-tubulin complex component 5-like [Dorcoceras hygrometricum]
MSLFDLQDVCIAIGSIATLDLPMVVDLIGIYGLKGPYCTLTTTDWLFQALSVIPRVSWGDVARRFTMIRWAVALAATLLTLKSPPPPPPRAAAVFAGKIVSGQFDEENPFVLISSALLVQPDEGVSDLVVDRIGYSAHMPKVKKSLQCIYGQRTQSTKVSEDFSNGYYFASNGLKSALGYKYLEHAQMEEDERITKRVMCKCRIENKKMHNT